MAAVTLLYLRLRGLHYGWNTVAYLVPPLLRNLPQLLVIGVALRLAQTAVARGSLREYLRAVARPRWLLLWARCFLAAILLVYTYTWLKVSIPLLRAELYDEVFWRIDRWIHFGLSPSVFAIELAAGTPFARWIDDWYALWVPTLPILTAYFFAAGRDDQRRNFALAMTLLWTLGAWGYLVAPALGPCYASPDVLDGIRAAIPRAIRTQNGLWHHYLVMVRGRSGILEGFQPYYGVAAMPSLHVGAHALFAIWAFRHQRWLYVPMMIATALTFIGSLVTGWHYAIDGYAGILLAWMAVRVADRFEPIADGPSASEAASTEPASASGSIPAP